MLESAPHQTSISHEGTNRTEPEQTQTRGERGEKMVGWLTRIPMVGWSFGQRPFFDCNHFCPACRVLFVHWLARYSQFFERHPISPKLIYSLLPTKSWRPNIFLHLLMLADAVRCMVDDFWPVSLPISALCSCCGFCDCISSLQSIHQTIKLSLMLGFGFMLLHICSWKSKGCLAPDSGSA